MRLAMLIQWMLALSISVAQPEISAEPQSPAKPPDLQALIDAHPGTMILVSRDYEIDKALRISTDNTGLYGCGKIIQANENENILEIVGAHDVRIKDLIFTRKADHLESIRHAIHARDCSGVELVDLKVVDNRSIAGTVYLEHCRASRITGCSVTNYKRVGVDDRTGSDLYGYAFRVIDGTGILVTQGTDIQILGNRIEEKNIFPTPETKEKFHLGDLTNGRNPMKKGPLAPSGDYANNWHQGSAIVVTSPEETERVLICDNIIQNAAQGIDIHADLVTCSRNIIDHAFIGIKCMHGARSCIISENHVSRMDLWGLIMMPGTASHVAEPAAGDKPARKANLTTRNIIANNVFSDFGQGYEYYNWKESRGGVISLESGQLKENPVMTDVLIQGNIIYDSSVETLKERAVMAAPLYEYAVFMSPEPSPQRLTFKDNLFDPGHGGISNLPLEPSN